MSITQRDDRAGFLPALSVLGDRQARGLFRSLVESRRWWVLPIMSDAAVELATAIEEAHYQGAASRDYLVAFGPFLVVFCRKSRMPASALATLLVELHPRSEWTKAQWREDLAERDIIVPLSAEEPDLETLAQLRAWLCDWLGQGATA